MESPVMLINRRSRRDFVGTGLVGGLSLMAAQHASGENPRPMQSFSNVAVGGRGAVASVNPLATRAALNRFQQGGNAIDAAIAASLVLSVVDSHNSGLGGGGLALIRVSNGNLVALDGREVAPKRTNPDQYLDSEGLADSQLSQEGPLAVAVPGLLRLLSQMSLRFGRLDLIPSLNEAAEIAESGFEVSDYFARVLQASAERLQRYRSSAEVFLDPAGQAWRAGAILRQPDMARTLRQLADQGVEWFYQGEFAERLELFMQQQGGFMRSDDLAEYQVIERAPIISNYRNKKIVGFPPPSSGGIHVAQMLGMLEPFDVAGLFAKSPPTGTHLLLEVMKRAMADRAYWLGDADFVRVPRGLLDADYLRQLSGQIDLERSTTVSGHGIPPTADAEWFGRGGHTTHLTTADAEGNVVALTQTINTSFGSKMVLPGTGVVLNNEMDDFSLAPGVRNAFGLLGSAANQLAPGKRPLSSMSPTIVLDDNGRPIFTCGAAGGPRIITAVLQALIGRLDLNLSVSEAISAPRVHHQWSPDRAIIERTAADTLQEALAAMGHDVSRASSLAVAQAIGIQESQFTAVADPRVPSAAGGF
jgi:gamma-glutamyltranspeptidase/glutathione hydrolase